MWIFSSVHSLFLLLSFQYMYISMLNYIYIKSLLLLLLFKYYSLLRNVVCYKYVSFLVLFSIQFIIKPLFHLCIFSTYLSLLPSACGQHVIRSSIFLGFFLQVLIMEPYNLLLQYGLLCSGPVAQTGLEILFTGILELILLLGWKSHFLDPLFHPFCL